MVENFGKNYILESRLTGLKSFQEHVETGIKIFRKNKNLSEKLLRGGTYEYFFYR